MSNSLYWGEIPAMNDTDSGIAAIEREQITKPMPLDVEGPPLHQPSSRHHPPTNEILPNQHFQMDPIVIHSIRLLQYIKRAQTSKAEVNSAVKSDPDAPPVNIGPIPPYEGPPLKDSSCKTYTTQEDYERPFVRGEGKPPPPIDDITCRKLLRRSTAALCAHMSFESTSESVLETLTDVCHEFLCQMTRHLANAADRRATHGCLGFPDIVERVFHDMGLGSVSELHTFYQQRVIGYHRRLMRQCEQLMAQRKQPTQVKGHTDGEEGDTLHVISIKEENGGDMQFPLLDENDEVTDAEQLLNIESLGALEITVEHETSAGLTTEVDTKWPGRAVPGASRLKSSNSNDEASESETGGIPVTPQSTMAATPSETVATPHSSAAPTPHAPNSQDEVTLPDPGSASSLDIFSPSNSTGGPSKAKKKKKA